MIKALIKLPFWIIGTALSGVFGVLRLAAGTVIGLFRFLFSRLFGVIFGVTVGLLLGKGHVGVKLFRHRRKGARD